jgi:hypothetical protein
MSIQIYKPNKSNSGFGFSFSAGNDKKSGEPVLFVNGIAQYSWNNGSGTFQRNSNNPEKTVTVKFNEFECGAIINCIKNRYEWSTYHKSNNNQTTIKFTPWDKIAAIKSYNPKTKEYTESKQKVPAFGMTISKSGGNTFKLSLEPGECECISSFLKLLLNKIHQHRLNKSYTEPFDV